MSLTGHFQRTLSTVLESGTQLLCVHFLNLLLVEILNSALINE